MEAKDTLMSRDYAKSLILTKHCSPETKPSDIVVTAVEESLITEQAEVSFRAGFEEGRLYGKQESLFNQAIIDQWVKDSRQEGIRAVVNWGLETCPHDLFGEGTQCYKRACDMCWAEQIKLWEVESGS